MRSLIQSMKQVTFGWMRVVGQTPHFRQRWVIKVMPNGEVVEVNRPSWPRKCVLMLRSDQALIQQLILPASAYPKLDTLAVRRGSTDWPIAGPTPFVAWQVDKRRSSWTRMAVNVLLCERRAVEAALDQVRRAGYRAESVDVQRQGCNQGYGVNMHLERPRQSKRGLRLAGYALLAALAAGPLLTQFLVDRAELQAAESALDAARIKAAPVLLERSELLARQDRLKALKASLIASGRVSTLVETISDVLPEQAYLTSAEIVDDQISLSGEARSASEVLATFDRVEPFRDVRFTAPVIRLGSKGRDRFDLGMRVSLAEPVQ
ncbi:MAG: PilN domain-containing protein [Pseudomonadota bacterium]